MIDKLSENQIKILQYLSDGNSGPVISKKLFISYNTFKYHKKVILKKLRANTISEAIAKYNKHIVTNQTNNFRDKLIKDIVNEMK